MKTIKLSDFYPYDRNKGGIQELHHKIEETESFIRKKFDMPIPDESKEQ